MSQTKPVRSDRKFPIILGVVLLVIGIIAGAIIGFFLAVGTEKVVVEESENIQGNIDEQTLIIADMFRPIYERLEALPTQEQTAIVAQLEEIVMNSVISTPDPEFDNFIVPKDSAKYGPTSNFVKQENSVFYPLMNEKYSVYSVFEDFEGTVYLPGLTLTDGQIVKDNGVDADDGKINDNSKGGQNYLVYATNSIVFDFDESGIPSTPNYFGVVLTDYQCEQINDWYTTPIIYRMYGDGVSPIIEDTFTFGSRSENISEDTFIGFFNSDGITSVEIEVDQPGCSRDRLLQIDHIQYGLLK